MLKDLLIFSDSLMIDKYENVYPYLRLGVLYNIFVAITENADNAIETIGGGLIKKVHQVALNLVCQYRDAFHQNPYLQDQLIMYRAVVDPFLKKQSNNLLAFMSNKTKFK